MLQLIRSEQSRKGASAQDIRSLEDLKAKLPELERWGAPIEDAEAEFARIAGGAEDPGLVPGALPFRFDLGGGIARHGPCLSCSVGCWQG